VQGIVGKGIGVVVPGGDITAHWTVIGLLDDIDYRVDHQRADAGVCQKSLGRARTSHRMHGSPIRQRERQAGRGVRHVQQILREVVYEISRLERWVRVKSTVLAHSQSIAIAGVPVSTGGALLFASPAVEGEWSIWVHALEPVLRSRGPEGMPG